MATLPVPPNYPLDGVPLGSIVAYVGPLASLPPNWAPCDGQTLSAPGSPLDGAVAPQLNDLRFPMGVSRDLDVLRPGGTNEIPQDGDHAHVVSGMVQPDTVPVVVRQAQQEDDLGTRRATVAQSPHDHQFSGAATRAGVHAHGSENRPRYLSVIWIIRVA